MDELVSVIVPVCNAGDTIQRCVSSVTGQTYSSLQIILVDDGSTDNSGAACDTFAAEDARVEVIHQENKGVAAARNAGLARAKGAWIAFADADDYVSPYYIEDMIAASADGCGMVICRPIYVSEGSGFPQFMRASSFRSITGFEACLRNFGNEMNLFNSSWGKLFRARLWSDLRYPEGKINEDMFLSHTLLYRSGQIVLTDAYSYAYVQTADSITRSAFSLKRLDVLDAWMEGVRFFSEAGEPDLAHIARRIYCSRVFDARYVCGKLLPHERGALNMLRLRAKRAYTETGKIKGYIDCSEWKAISYRIMLLIGRWCPLLYGVIFVRGRWRMYM